ncbi:MAG TPA: capsule assembly Wzi family protein [Kofleriaceae bacterium]
MIGPRPSRANRLARCLAAAIALAAAPSAGSPNISLDDPVYDELDQRELAGVLPPFRGGLAPLTEGRVHELAPETPALPAGWWIRPIARAALRVEIVDEAERGYATAARPRDVAGVLALSCERQEGRPCGNGAGLDAELDAAAGHGAWLAGAVRLRAHSARDRGATGLDLDRAHVIAELGPIAAELGRDVLALGPAAHTQLGWSTNAPPLDQLRLSGARPLAVSPGVRANATYVLGRLAAPQTYPGDLVSIVRAQLDLGDRLELGAMQLLQLGGDGAPALGPWDFVLEHVRRRDASASASDSSNRRVGLDVTARIADLGGLGGARLTYQLMFEDLRTQLVSALRHDADHVAGVETRWLTLEWQKTGIRAYEHAPRVTGFTTGGHIVGDPLGPGAQAVFAGARIPARWGVVMPWAEVARLSSDTYRFGDGPIVRTGEGTAELRFRIGARARVPVGHGLEIDPEIALEDVERASFVPGARSIGAVFRAVLVWRPPTPGSAPPTAAAASPPDGPAAAPRPR